MAHKFRMYWRRETGCDEGTPVDLEDLDAAIQLRISKLAGSDEGPIEIRLPFLDRREWRRRSELLRRMTFTRAGRTIRYVPAGAAAPLRDQAADAMAAHPAWLAAPVQRQFGYFRVWRNVSVALQNFLRRAAPEIYFRDPARYEDRRAAGALLVYQASHVCRGMRETEFAYDIANGETLPAALSMIGGPMQQALGEAQRRVEASGRPELARRYVPVWHEDIVQAVRQRPRRLLALLGDEAALIDAVITLGTARDLGMVKPFVRSVLAVLRSFHDCDMRELGAPLLAAATRALEREMDRPIKRRAKSPRGAPSQRVTRRLVTLRPLISRLPQATTNPAFAAAGTSGRCKPDSAACR
ncbi:MAG TPA: hypothetical protein VGR73_11095 [Bryobacteraceae bacterium]|nr:hypothetical protein [Bryobacteraceae bacterium]